jgi:ribosomal protein S18 acetylase RimI-like enzyme
MTTVSHAERIPEARLDDLVALALAEPGALRPADRARVRKFRQHVTASALTCAGFAVQRGGEWLGGVVTLELPGRTALVMPCGDGAAPESSAALRAAVQHVQCARPYYIQALIEPDAYGRAALLQRTGFRRLTTLRYLERDAKFPWVDPPRREAEWIAYSAEAHAQFALTLAATYVDSADCPEVTGLRSIDDTLAGHRAAGRFDPTLWELAVVDGASAGCLLLCATDDAMMEVVYMGVTPAFRRRGIGELLLRRALEQARARRGGRVTLVVDERNAAAQRLYARMGFARSATRVVWLLRNEAVEKL